MFTESQQNRVKSTDLNMYKDIRTLKLCGKTSQLSCTIIFSFMNKAENGFTMWNG